VRTIDWQDGHIVAIDQTRLPAELVVLHLRTVDALIDAIKLLAIRGAPALGVAGALGVALAGGNADLAARLKSARPTAVNLAWGVDRVMSRPDATLDEALAVLEEDVTVNRALSERGADWLLGRVGRPVTVQTHCNAGALACVERGTALGVVQALHERGALDHVYVDETRPLLQGSRLTTWELAQQGIAHTLVADAAGPSVIARGLVNVVIVGADRVAANGDVVNKIGTYPLALAAARAGIPFVVAAPESTIDAATPTGADTPIEVRDSSELTLIAGQQISPRSTVALNNAFDVTPADLVTAIVTEVRVFEPVSGGFHIAGAAPGRPG
jgi:S-methyl-5-thioribose-1-phosphate isomerase